MKTLLLAVLILLASAGLAPAQTKSSGTLDLEYKQRTPALRPVPPQKIEEDTTQAVRELDRQRTDRMLREVQPGPSRRPDLDRDVTQGIQTRGLGGR
jgi:curli biogenesis system outer membrane secretion channel CsgG